MIVCWLRHARRLHGNPVLSRAILLARQQREPLLCLAPLTLAEPAGQRSQDFLQSGLRALRANCAREGIPLHLVRASLATVLGKLAGLPVTLVCDAPRLPREFREDAALDPQMVVHRVFSHALVPPPVVIQKAAWSAASFRPHLERHALVALEAWFRQDSPALVRVDSAPLPPVLEPFVDTGVPELLAPSPDRKAWQRLEHFLDADIGQYGTGRNDPSTGRSSGISPWLAKGFIAVQDVAGEVLCRIHDTDDPLEAIDRQRRSRQTFFGKAVPEDGPAAFLEELLVRRDLAANWCHFNPLAGTWDGLPEWARNSLRQHQGDERRWSLEPDALEAAESPDPYWNAAQRQLKESGVIHGYLRMYWGKQFVYWSRDPAAAFDLAMLFNERYALDGDDPNGYAGVAWCFGLHDRPWPERPVWGTVRAMVASGLERKFDMKGWLERWGG